KLPEGTFHSLQELVLRHRDPADPFTFADFDFIHAPGGHAPMVDFRDDPWLGETLHVARENDVTISLICHAPVAVTSTRQRIDAQGRSYSVKDNRSSPPPSRPSPRSASGSRCGSSTRASPAGGPDSPTSSTWPSRKPASPSRPPPTSPPRNWPTSRPCGCSPATARRPSTSRPPSCAASSPAPEPPGAPAASS